VPINASGAAGSALTVWGSWVTDVSPDALPEGVSPDNQEIVFEPGGHGSRPCFQKVPGISFPAVGGVIPTAVGGKSFVLPNGDIKNLYLDSAGRLWVEDLTNNPGTIALLLQSTPGSFYRSITQFGREYIALSDGLHGTEIPLQYDGTFLDRVTMDGPGAPPTVANLQLPAVQMVSSGNTLVRQNNSVTAYTATAHNLKVGYQAQISNVPDSNSTTVNQTNNSGNQVVNSSVWDLNSGQYRSLFNPGTSTLSAFIAEGLGFTIPSNATILGVVASFGIQAQGTTTGTVAQVALWYSGSQEGTAKSPGTAITVAPTVNSYGSASDLWGASLTPTIVNDPSFGFAISVTADSERVFLDFPFTVQIYYTLSGSGTVAMITSIVINNETNPGLALITTSEPHGLIPDIYVSIVGVEPGTVANVSAAQWSAGKTTLTTSTNHNLNPGAVIQVGSVTTSTGSTTFQFNGTFTVESVPAPNQLAYYQTPITATDPDFIQATANTGAVTVAWPIPDDTPTPTYFEIDSCPSPTTFYIPVTYSDGTWTSGTVGFIWEGTFYVTEVSGPNEFVYYQPGPNGATSAIGTVTPFGQAAPGLHLCQVLWLTRQGAIPAPSPPVTFIANGGQYVQVSNIPIGPPNVVGRILAFTGAQPVIPGVLPPFYYIPVPAQLEGQIVSTATVINDNTTTTATLDFSDNTLFAAIGISVPGNNLADQIVLDGALGFRTYLDRLLTIGQRNTVNNFLNLGFEGGALSTSPNSPLGWTSNSTVPTLVHASNYGSASRPGIAWAVIPGSGSGVTNVTLSQSAYLDAYGDPIILPNTYYSVRFMLVAFGNTAINVQVSLTSASTGFSSTATFNGVIAASWTYFSTPLTVITPQSIPSDLLLNVVALNVPASSTLAVDEVQLFYTANPYLDNQSYASYVSNPEGMDGSTGQWGPEDTAKIMDMGVVRGTLNILTQAPTGKLHETTGSTVTEPSGWTINPVAGQCGLLSAFSLAVSQADDATEAGGGQWMAWASDVGAMIFGGGLPEKISQEIQPNWNDPTRPNTAVQINMAAATAAWAMNDPVARLLYFGLPIGTATAPSQIYVLNYQHLGTAEAIAASPPFHPSFAGKLIATDNSRKWTHWLRAMNGAARMYRSAGQLTSVFFGGNGQTLGAAAGFGNIYTLNPSKFTDDDYGQIDPYYVSYFFLDPQTRQALQIKGGRLLLAYVLAQIQPMPGDSNSQVTLTYYGDSLNNPWPLTTTRTMTTPFYGDRNFGGGMAQGERIAIKISSSPVTGTDNSYLCTRFEAFFRNARILISGVNS
jgi:hypothetical protein